MKVKFNTRIITANYLSEPICISRNWDVIKGSKYGYVVTYEGDVDKVGREGEREKLKLYAARNHRAPEWGGNIYTH